MDDKDKMIRELNKDYKSACEEYKKLKKAYEELMAENIELTGIIAELELNGEYI